MAVEKFDYNEAARDAAELLEEFGQTAFIPRTVMDTPPNEWTAGEEITTQHSVTLVVLPIQERDIDGTLIKAGDQQILIAALGLSIEPTTTDKVMIGGVPWTLTNIKPLAPAGVLVLYDCIGSR